MNAKVFTEWVTHFNQQMRSKFGESCAKKEWLLLDNSATHAHQDGEIPKAWGEGFWFCGCKH